MQVYTSDRIRNIVLLGHGGTGKTSVAESMAYTAGITTRQGRIADGNTISDFDPEEIRRGFSINTSIIPIEWNGYKLNILDTPGYFDFAGEVEEALRAAESAVIVVSAKDGVQVGTEFAWERCERMNLPRFIFINGMDEEGADMVKALEQLQDKFGKSIAPFQVAFKENGKFAGFVDVVKMQGRRFEGDKVVPCDIPAGMEAEIEPVRTMIIEAVAETDEDLMERYFEGEDFTEEEIVKALHSGIEKREIVPVFCGCAFNGTGIAVLMNSICEFLPSMETVNPTLPAADLNGAPCEVATGEKEPFSAFVFKTMVDPFLGKISFLKINSGILRKDDPLNNVSRDTTERMGRLYVMRGKEQIEVPELHAGDIGAVAKLNVTATGDTMCGKRLAVTFPPINFPESMMCMAIETRKGDEDKVSTGLARLREEDPTIRVEVDRDQNQQLLYGAGEQHLDVIVNKLQNKFRLGITLKKPKVAYRETIRGQVRVQGKHKKQSGGHGQYGDVHMIFEPSGDLSKPYVFEEKIFGGSVPKNYFPAVEKGIQESVQQGVLAGYPMVGLKATLVDGSYHPVDSSEMAFKTATILAFKEGIPKANPVIMEPIMALHITVDEAYMGDIIGDLNKRRGRVLGMEHKGGRQVIEAEVPMGEVFSYPTDLRSITQGRGSFTMELARYEETPKEVQDKIIEEAAKEQ